MGTPFDLGQDTAYRIWRDAKRASHPRKAADLVVDVADPRALTHTESEALLQRVATASMAIYRSPVLDQDKRIPLALAGQLGLHRLDGNWLADEDGISPIAVAPAGGDRPAFIPYTNRPIKWHTDGYYHPGSRRISTPPPTPRSHPTRSGVDPGQPGPRHVQAVHAALRPRLGPADATGNRRQDTLASQCGQRCPSPTG